MKASEVIRINDKYTVHIDFTQQGGFRATRYNEPWRDLTGDNLVLAMAYEIEKLRNIVDSMKTCETCKYDRRYQDIHTCDHPSNCSLDYNMWEWKGGNYEIQSW